MAISSKLEFARFTEVFHDERMTAALLDRLTFKSTVMVIEGESYCEIRLSSRPRSGIKVGQLTPMRRAPFPRLGSDPASAMTVLSGRLPGRDA